MGDSITVSSLATVSVDVSSTSNNGFVGKAQITDYTANSIAQNYQQDVQAISAILNGTSQSTDASNLSSLVSDLKNLLVNGVTMPVDPSDPSILKTYYMTSNMAQNLQLLFAGMQSIGINVVGTTDPTSGQNVITLTSTDVNNLRNLSASSLLFDPLFNFAATATAQNSSTQAMVELNFVKQGNDLLSNALSKLQQAITATQTVLGQLGQLQNVHNEIVISSRGNFSPTVFNINITSATSPSAYLAAYETAASAFFGSTISPTTALFPSNSAFFPTQVTSDTAILNPNSSLTQAEIQARASDIINGIANTNTDTPFITTSSPTQGSDSFSGILKLTLMQSPAGAVYQIEADQFLGSNNAETSTSYGTVLASTLSLSNTSNVIYFLPNSTYSTTFQQRYGLSNPMNLNFTDSQGTNFSISQGLEVNAPTGSPVGTQANDPEADFANANILLNNSNFGTITIDNPSPNTYTTLRNVSTSNILQAMAAIAPSASYSLVTANNIAQGTGVLQPSAKYEAYQQDFSAIAQSGNFYEANLTGVSPSDADFGLYSITDMSTGKVVATNANLYQNTGSLNIPLTIAFYPVSPESDPTLTGVSPAFLSEYSTTNGFTSSNQNNLIGSLNNALPSTNGINFEAIYSNNGWQGGSQGFTDSDPPQIFADYKAFAAISQATQVQSGDLTTFPGYASNENLIANVNYLNGRGFNVQVATPAAASGNVWLGLVNNVFQLDSRGISGFIQLQIELASIRGILSAQIPILSAITSAINVTSANPNGQVDPNSLLGTLKTVLGDLNRVFVNASGKPITSGMPPISALVGLRSWLLDNYNQRGTMNANLSGQIQQNITNAITAGQSLNDTQQNNVRNFLFVFQQYYQAASTVIQQITQIIQNMASAIAQ
jgi:hypothetical protein